MKTTVMGNEPLGRTSQWRFRWAKPGQIAMEKYGFSGTVAGKVSEGLKSLADVLFAPELDQESMTMEEASDIRSENERKRLLWHEFANNLIAMWALLEQHEDFTDPQVDQVHFLTNKFMQLWISLTGDQHMTNYIHIIGSGHLTYFAKRYKNLYRFSQQGWEAMNQLIKHFYFNNTNHGGSTGNGGKDKDGSYSNLTVSGDHCRPLMRLCQRSIMWRLGHGDAFFEEKLIDQKTSAEVTSKLMRLCSEFYNLRKFFHRGEHVSENVTCVELVMDWCHMLRRLFFIDYLIIKLNFKLVVTRGATLCIEWSRTSVLTN